MYCQYCKTPIPEDAAFCTECGKPVEETEYTDEEVQTAQQFTEQFADRQTDLDGEQQAESVEEPPPIQPTKSFDSVEDDSVEDDSVEDDSVEDAAQDLQKTAEEQALDHLFGNDADVGDNVDEDENVDRADLTQQIASVDAQTDTSKENDASQMFISADLKKRKLSEKASKKEASKKKNSSSDLTRQMSQAEVEEQPRRSDNEDVAEQTKASTGIAGNPRQTRQQGAENQNVEQIINLDNTSDRHVVTIIVVVVIAIFAVIALTFALVYFDPFDLQNTQESSGSGIEDVTATDGEDPETVDNGNNSNENEEDDNIYAVDSI